MKTSLIVPIAADKPEYEHTLPYVFNFSEDGFLLCIKSIQGLDLTRFDKIYFVILQKLDERYDLAELLKCQFRKMGLKQAVVTILNKTTKSQVETVYECIRKENIEDGIFVKDSDSYFTCDFLSTNGIAIYPLDKLDMVNPQNKSFVNLDDQFYITNIIEKKIISRYFNAGGYFFEDVNVFCTYYEKLQYYSQLFMSHIVFSMLLDDIAFRPFEVEKYVDLGTKKMYYQYLLSRLNE